MQNKRGLSTIVATLLIILLTLIAVGIIWVVIRNVVQSGAEQVDLSTKCVSVELSAVTVVNGTGPAGNYTVTLHRGSDSQGDIGVKINVFRGATVSSGIMNFGAFGDLDALGTVTKTVDTTIAPATTVTNGNKIEFTPFFRDSEGNDQLCSQIGTYNF